MSTFDPSSGVIDGSVTPQYFFRADMLAVADGTAVSAIDDVLGAPQWLQANAARQPLFKTNIFGTKPSLLFQGTDDFVSRDPAPGSNFSTVITLFKPSADITTGVFGGVLVAFGNVGSGLASGLALGALTGGLTNEIATVQYPQADRSAWTQAGASYAAASTHLLTTRWDAATTRYHIFYNGGANLTNATTGAPNHATAVGLAHLGATNNAQSTYTGHVGVVLIYDTVLSDAQKASVHSYLQDVWGATAADYDAGWVVVPSRAPQPVISTAAVHRAATY